MSLNGLEAQAVADAHEAASEPGSWFVLKYAARDEVELMDQGVGGLPQVRKTVEEYEDTSPLYGFLRYRRRVVIIRYLPEGCSRLIQARVAVHFNAVCERFAPYDSTLEITDADQLSDTKLSATCSLHAATASTASSASSNRRRRLNEIAEVDEEEQQKRASKRISRSGNNDEAPPPGAAPAPAPAETAVTLNSELADSPEESKFSAASTTQVPKFVGAEDAGDSSAPEATAGVTQEENRRMSSQSGRSDLHSYSYPHSRPKIKLGPRPSFDAHGNRPQTAGNFRPISSIPAGLKLFGGNKNSSNPASKKKKESDDLSTATSPSVESDSALAAFIIPEDRSLAESGSTRPATSSGVTLAPRSPSAMSTSTLKAGMTPEKARLMKAMKMREKKKKQQRQKQEEAREPPVPALSRSGEEETTPKAEQQEGSIVDEQQKEEKETEPNPETATEAETETEPKTTTMATDEASVLTTSSRPTSPVVASSEADQSTKASSISECTEDTIEAEKSKVTPEETSKVAVPEASPETLADREEPVQRPSGTTPSLHINTNTEETKTAAGETDVETGNISGSPVEALPSCWSPFRTSSQPFEQEQRTPEALVETKWVADVALVEAEPEVKAKEDVGVGKEDGFDSDTRSKLSSKFSSHSSAPKADAAAVGEEEETAEIVIVSAGESDGPATNAATRLSSKFSSNNLRKTTLETGPVPAAESLEAPAAAASTDSTDVTQSGRSLAETKNVGDDHSEAETVQTNAKTQLKINIEPVHASDDTQRPVSRAETNLADGEALLDELDDATVEEARPVTVQTPLTPAFPSPATNITDAGKPPSRGSHIVRTASNPVRGVLMPPPTDVSQSSARSMSGGAAYLHKITQQQQAGSNLTSKKTGMGSGISQRIKALEMLSAEPKDSVPDSGSPRDRPSSAFFSVKKGRTPSRSPSVMERATPFTRRDTSSAASTREVSPERTENKQARTTQRERSGSVASRMSMFEPAHPQPPASHSPSPRAAGSPRAGRPESVSVTARIVRDPDTVLRAPTDPSQFQHLDLKQPSVTVDHEHAPSPPAGPAEALAALTTGDARGHERSISRDSVLSDGKGENGAARRSSMSLVKDFIKERRRSVTSNDGRKSPTKSPTNAAAPSASLSSRLSFSSARASLSKDREMGVTSPGLSDDLSDDTQSVTSEKRTTSRAGRLMSRISQLGSRGKLSMSSSSGGLATTVTEEEVTPEPVAARAAAAASAAPPRPATTATSSAPAIVAHLGDVNVQFPDNLLWKRRNLCLDAAGYILLSVSAASSTTTSSKAAAVAGLRRFHLSDFRRPVVPDVEMQELPNSVVLDFMEGGGLQFACEDRAGQMNVLKVLSDAHAKHALMFEV